nr:hypothetical protein [Acholeplasmatales bacterium]
MCKTTNEELIKKIASDNVELINKVIKYINLELKVDLYKEYNNTININTTNSLLKDKVYYKQVIFRLFNLIDKYTLKEKLLWNDVVKGENLLRAKRAATVKSPNYGTEASFNDGYRPNTQEQTLIAIEEEALKQAQRINKYELFVKSFKDNKQMIKDFILLLPNTTQAEIIIRHHLDGE